MKRTLRVVVATKKTADGRTTSYFHTDISKEEKALLGDFKPKKIDKPVDESKTPEHKAGAYEERNMTTWCKEHIVKTLEGVEFALPNAQGTIQTTKARNVHGEAEILCVRGKRKFLFDFSLALDFKGTINGQQASGTLKFSDISADCGDEYEVAMEVGVSTPASVRSILNSFVKSSTEGLQPLLIEQLKGFVAEYHKQ